MTNHLRSLRSALGAVVAGLAVGGLGGVAQAAPIDPSTISGMVLRLDASAITPVSDGTAITNWADTSPGGLNPATHTSGPGTAPVYESNIMPNGKPVVQFNGTSNILFEGLAISGNMTWFIVYKENHIPSGFEALASLDNGTANPNDTVLLYPGSGQNITIAMDYSTLGSSAGFNPAFDTSPHTLGFSYDGGDSFAPSSYQTNFDETNETLAAGGPLGLSPTGGAIGARYGGSGPDGFFDGDIAEIIIYNNVLTSDQVAGVQEFLTDKWLIAPEPTSATLLVISVIPLLRRRRHA